MPDHAILHGKPFGIPLFMDFADFRETWVGNSVSWFAHLRETWLLGKKQCFMVCPLFEIKQFLKQILSYNSFVCGNTT
jgi:hypothetical protein